MAASILPPARHTAGAAAQHGQRMEHHALFVWSRHASFQHLFHNSQGSFTVGSFGFTGAAAAARN
ncbi:hypothetical protein [Arthrobacter sp. NPDC093139]|uniref:hypothetical protein n=1 Tax=Arthrobacter sp. NPDC093139 TaxID=3363945 RepID=UPI0037FE253A